jgi:putative hydrolase of the HAD superfamily
MPLDTIERETTRLRAVTFDVTHTLIHCPRLAEIYAEVLTRHGIDTTPGDMRQWIPVVWQELACRVERGRDRFSTHPDGARGWWWDFLHRLCQYLEAPEPSRFAAAELFHRFARADAWEIYPEVRPVLEALQRMGIALAVVSNWDERLGPLLTRLDLIRYFDAVVVSSQVGVEKPDPRIFQHTLDLLEVPAHAVMHVGDSGREDVEGAVSVGMKALHVVRRQGAPRISGLLTEGSLLTGELPDLAELPHRIASGF